MLFFFALAHSKQNSWTVLTWHKLNVLFLGIFKWLLAVSPFSTNQGI